jgi:hypothetical protein
VSAQRPDFVVAEVLGVKDTVDDINGVSLRGSTSLSPPPPRIAGMWHRT